MVIPGTAVEAVFIPGNPYPPIFREAKATGRCLASVNAGNADEGGLWVGGGGINAAFASIFRRSSGQSTEDLDAYQEIHTRLHRQAVAGGKPFLVDPGGPLRLSRVVPSTIRTREGTFDGTAFVDVFAPRAVPHGNPLNYAMIYAAPPNGHRGYARSSFLAAVQATASAIVTVVREHNEHHATGALTPIRAIRTCLFSGSIYRHPDASRADVAKAILAGFRKALGKGVGGIEAIEFENARDGGKPVFDAIRSELAP